jgi:ribosomal protein S27AE
MDGRWRAETEAIITGFKEWRQAHPRATLTEIEAALDSRWAVARARLVADAALARAQADLRALPWAERPRCPDCGVVLEARGQEVRQVTTTHEQPVTLTRHRAVCPACGTGLFPPG